MVFQRRPVHAVDVEAANARLPGTLKAPPNSPATQPQLQIQKWTWVHVFWIIVRVVVIYALLSSWLQVMPKRGVFLPMLTQMYTSAYTPPHRVKYDRVVVPPKTRPRVVVTLSTLPNRLPMIHNTVKSLVAQDRKPDAIYVNIPLGTHKRSGLEYFIPEEIQKMKEVTVLRPDRDVGPLTKLVPALIKETDPSTIVITVDDDKLYPPDLVSTLERYSLMDPHAAFGACGWGFMWWPKPVGVLNAYAPYIMRGSFGRHVDVLQAVCGNAYRRGHFGKVRDLLNFPKVCFTVDDVWIAGYIHHHGVDRVLIPDRLDPEDTEWKKAENSKFKLNSFNDDNFIHIQCIEAVEKMYGRWMEARYRGQMGAWW